MRYGSFARLGLAALPALLLAACSEPGSESLVASPAAVESEGLAPQAGDRQVFFGDLHLHAGV